jgi:hypothetical protein
MNLWIHSFPHSCLSDRQLASGFVNNHFIETYRNTISLWSPCTAKWQIQAKAKMTCSSDYRPSHQLGSRIVNFFSESSAIGTGSGLTRWSMPITSTTARALMPFRSRRIRETCQQFVSLTRPSRMGGRLLALFVPEEGVEIQRVDCLKKIVRVRTIVSEWITAAR